MRLGIVIFAVAALNLTTDESVPLVERLAAAVSVNCNVPLPVIVPLIVVVAPAFMVSVLDALIVKVFKASIVNVPAEPSPTLKSLVEIAVSLEIIRLLIVLEFPERVWAEVPFITRLALVPINVPAVIAKSPEQFIVELRPLNVPAD